MAIFMMKRDKNAEMSTFNSTLNDCIKFTSEFSKLPDNGLIEDAFLAAAVVLNEVSPYSSMTTFEGIAETILRNHFHTDFVMFKEVTETELRNLRAICNRVLYEEDSEVSGMLLPVICCENKVEFAKTYNDEYYKAVNRVFAYCMEELEGLKPNEMVELCCI